MNILIVSATEFEVKPLLDFLEINEPLPGVNIANKQLDNHDFQVLITGIGMVNTAFMVGRHSINHYDLVINAGVCGAFDKKLELGQIVNITEDILSEMGAEDGDDFLTYNQMNLPGEYIYSARNKDSYLMVDLLKKVKAITVNTVHGNEANIEKVKQLYNPDVESMEGAAFFAACSGIQGNHVQIRAISNYVEKRNKENWKMPLAIKNLNDFLITFIKNV